LTGYPELLKKIVGLAVVKEKVQTVEVLVATKYSAGPVRVV